MVESRKKNNRLLDHSVVEEISTLCSNKLHKNISAQTWDDELAGMAQKWEQWCNFARDANRNVGLLSELFDLIDNLNNTFINSSFC